MAVSKNGPNNFGMLLIVIALAQFIITVDSTFMNVSITTLVKDLNTTVTGIQSTIALYTLVMAIFMIPGAKIADIFGRKKIFLIGLIIYGIGTITASLAHSLLTFVIGWSFLEGIGASLMLPSMMALIAYNFSAGKPRTKAYAIFAAIASIAAAIGPIIGGVFTTYLSWRLAFASEILIVMFILIKQSIILDAPLINKVRHFDFIGFILSAAGLASIVFGIILASSFGIVHARSDLTISGRTIIQSGQLSPTIWLCSAGIIILFTFYLVEKWRLSKNLTTLINVQLLKIPIITGGSLTLAMQFTLLAGSIYSLALYLQMILSYNAIKTGIALLPLSIAVMIAAILSARFLSSKFTPKRIIQFGFLIILAGVISMAVTARDAASGWDFALGLSLIGVGIGVLGSQNQNLMISSVPNDYSSETSGLINTFKNLGVSFGTATAGAMILITLTNVFTNSVDSSSIFSYSQKQQINEAVADRAQVVSNQQFAQLVSSIPQPQQQELISINQQARDVALQRVYIGLGAIGILGMFSTLILPKTKPINKLRNPSKLISG